MAANMDILKVDQTLALCPLLSMPTIMIDNQSSNGRLRFIYACSKQLH